MLFPPFLSPGISFWYCVTMDFQFFPLPLVLRLIFCARLPPCQELSPFPLARGPFCFCAIELHSSEAPRSIPSLFPRSFIWFKQYPFLCFLSDSRIYRVRLYAKTEDSQATPPPPPSVIYLSVTVSWACGCFFPRLISSLYQLPYLLFPEILPSPPQKFFTRNSL